MILRLFRNDFFVTALFLLAYLCTNSYIFAWDDQHLEIPLLKHLIDPSLYKGDYYVEGLSRNFSSFLYPLLAKIIRTDQIQPVYLFLFLVSRYFMFFWIFKIWQLVSKDRLAAAAAVLMFFLMGRTEEFLYRTFSHQEFSYIFMFGGFYFIYKERFMLAALMFGLGANIHAIYNLFPFLYMSVYILIFRRDRWVLLLKSLGVFVFFALPFLLWQIPHSMARGAGPPIPVSEWLPLYLISCQQNFFFWSVPLSEALKNVPFMLMRLEPYLYLLVLYLFLLLVEPKLRRDYKTMAVVMVSYALFIFVFYFSYINPSRFVIDLNLLRNEQFVRFMLMGYGTIWACHWVKEGKVWQAFAAALTLVLMGFGGVLLLEYQFPKYALVFAGLLLLFFILLFKPHWRWLRYAMIAWPLLFSFVSYTHYHYRYVQAKMHGPGLWQMHRNWVDMQKFVKNTTDKNALIMTPFDTDTGGFRIFSERKVLVCYRDCGIVGFDFNAILEWDKRVKDIEGFRMIAKSPPTQAVINAITKYKVDYIVFMNYYQPTSNNSVLTKLYQNEVFALYKVNKI